MNKFYVIRSSFESPKSILIFEKHGCHLHATLNFCLHDTRQQNQTKIRTMIKISTMEMDSCPKHCLIHIHIQETWVPHCYALLMTIYHFIFIVCLNVSIWGMDI
jgi:hypothetical protein